MEAHGSSPLFEDWAVGLADDAEVRELVVRLPEGKQQPNLVFAAARVAGVPLVPWAQARADVIDSWTRIELVARERRIAMDSGMTRFGTGPVEITCRVFDAALPSALPDVV